NRAFVADFLAVWDGAGPVLDVGTGTAQVPVELCRQRAGAQVIAIDAAEHMLAVGQRNVEAAGLIERARVQRCDAQSLPLTAGDFGAVISNSIVHHIPEPIAVLREMVRVLRPGGWLFVRDLMRPPDEEALRHLVNLYAAGANDHQRKMFADSLHAAL